jgi:hypothetical protein
METMRVARSGISRDTHAASAQRSRRAQQNQFDGVRKDIVSVGRQTHQRFFRFVEGSSILAVARDDGARKCRVLLVRKSQDNLIGAYVESVTGLAIPDPKRMRSSFEILMVLHLNPPLGKATVNLRAIAP